jgi:hypothetical protein
MEKKDLRKVTYTLEHEFSLSPSDICSDDFQKGMAELQELKKERQGLFHTFANRVIMVEDNNFQETYGLVEDLETGEMREIVPIRIKFNK